jgi:cytoskeleton protein RodZ
MKDVLEHLKTERLSRGWTLQDVSDRAGISITVLRALESGNSENLIAPSAVEALVRKYSAALRAQTEQIPDGAQKTTERDGAGSRKSFRYIVAGLLLSAVFAAVFSGTLFWQSRQSKDSSLKSHEPAASQSETIPSITPEQKTLPAHQDLALQGREAPEVEKQVPGPSSPDVTLSSVPGAVQEAIPPGEPHEKPVVSNQPPADVRPVHSLEIVTDQRTWIQVVVDGKNTETELLQAGETRKWQAMDKVDLVVGNGGGVRVQWDGKPVEISSRRGRVVRLTLPKSRIPIN